MRITLEPFQKRCCATGFMDPLVELGGLELLADVGEDVAKLRDDEKAGGVLVEDLEGITELAIEKKDNLKVGG